VLAVRSPWKQLLPLEPDKDYVGFASFIPPKRRRATWRLFRGSRAVASQLQRTEGVVGFSMLARPLRKEYATISLWVDDDALRAFAASGTHARLVEQLAPDMARTTFVRWTVKGRDGEPAWPDALRRRATTP
jgi:hypothetical protein